MAGRPVELLDRPMRIIGSRSCKPDAERNTQCVRGIPNAQFAISTGSAQEAHDIRAPHDGCGLISEHYVFWLAHARQDSLRALVHHDWERLFSPEADVTQFCSGTRLQPFAQQV